MAVSPNETKPHGCPDHGATSTRDCFGPTNSSVCLEFCPKTQMKRTTREGLNSMPSPTNASEALAILLVTTAAAMEEGKLSTEEAHELLKDIGKNLRV